MRPDYPWFLLAPGICAGVALWALLYSEYASAVFCALMGLAYLGVWCFANLIARGRAVPPEET